MGVKMRSCAVLGFEGRDMNAVLGLKEVLIN